MLHLGPQKWRRRRLVAAIEPLDDAHEDEPAEEEPPEAQAAPPAEAAAACATRVKRARVDGLHVAVAAAAYEAAAPASPGDCRVRVSAAAAERTHTVHGHLLEGCLPWSGSVPAPGATPPGGAAGGLGRWGEALVYNFLLATRWVRMLCAAARPRSRSRRPGCRVQWMNRDEEGRSPFDIKLQSADGALSSTTFIEVKTTGTADRNVFELSPAEWEFAATGPAVRFHIYRVYAPSAAGPAAVRIAVIENPVQLVKEGIIKLCLAV